MRSTTSKVHCMIDAVSVFFFLASSIIFILKGNFLECYFYALLLLYFITHYTSYFLINNLTLVLLLSPQLPLQVLIRAIIIHYQQHQQQISGIIMAWVFRIHQGSLQAVLQQVFMYIRLQRGYRVTTKNCLMQLPITAIIFLQEIKAYRLRQLQMSFIFPQLIKNLGLCQRLLQVMDSAH